MRINKLLSSSLLICLTLLVLLNSNAIFAKLVDRLRELEEFEKVATPEQTKKRLDLLECEWALI